MSAGRRKAETPGRQARPGTVLRVLTLVLGVLAAGGAWYFLVRAAITFGQAGRDGNDSAWAVCAGATVGAALCLLLVFVLGARAWAHLVGEHPAYTPRRSAGGKRSA